MAPLVRSARLSKQVAEVDVTIGGGGGGGGKDYDHDTMELREL